MIIVSVVSFSVNFVVIDDTDKTAVGYVCLLKDTYTGSKFIWLFKLILPHGGQVKWGILITIYRYYNGNCPRQQQKLLCFGSRNWPNKSQYLSEAMYLF